MPARSCCRWRRIEHATSTPFVLSEVEGRVARRSARGRCFDGAQYQAICQACHMADGKGGTGAAKIPALAGNGALAEPDYSVLLVLNGRGAMPYLRDTLTPAQIAGVVTHVRTSFGNRWAKPVTPADVERGWKMVAGD